MGVCCTIDSAAQARRWQAADRHACGHERGDVYPEHRLPMALPSKGLSAVQQTRHKNMLRAHSSISLRIELPARKSIAQFRTDAPSLSSRSWICAAIPALLLQ